MCLVFGVILILSQFIQGNSALDENAAGFRIINGTQAELGQFPGEVSLKLIYSDSHICGGSIISEFWVVTAAHCMYKKRSFAIRKPEDFAVVAGEIYDVRLHQAKHKRYVSRIVIHPDFKEIKKALFHDIALLRVMKPFVYNKFVQPRTLMNTTIEPGTTCQVSGWGVDHYKKKTPHHVLRYVDVPIVNYSTCRTWLEAFLPKNEPPGSICAGYEEGMRDACQGDSGGGLMCDGFLVGITSWGRLCGSPKSPGFYADVYYHADWILRTSGAPRQTYTFLLIIVVAFYYFFR